MPTHVVAQGEHLSRIVTQYGFTDPDAVWNRSENQQLKDSGRTPDLLFPGDELFIPPRNERLLTKAPNARYRAQVSSAAVVLRVVLQQSKGKPLANASGIVRIGSVDHAITTDAHGQFVIPIDAAVEAAELRLTGDHLPAQYTVMPMHVGHLDPVATISGQQSRLNNLGYAPGLASDPAALAFRSAVEEFQCDEHLGVDGVCGPATQHALKTAHGC